MELTDHEQRCLAGDHGKAMQLAMRLVLAAADVSGATELVEVDFAHINSCHWSGRLSEDFGEFLLAEGAELAVPTYTNASLIDCSTPSLRPETASPDAVGGARRLMEIYEQLGCEPIWTCAPYERTDARPAFGQQIIGSESNAVSFSNSVLGARTNKYGDLLDVAGALIGRVPFAGLHTDEGRRATVEVRVLDDVDRADPCFFHLLGTILGERCDDAVPVIVGIESANEDDLKAIAAAGATAGAVGMFHVVGITPEAPTLEAALQGRSAEREVRVASADLDRVRDRLTTATGDHVDAVCLGTPHFSVSEFAGLLEALGGREVHGDVRCLVTTSRAVHHELQLRGWSDALASAGVQVVLDTCTYYTPRADGVAGTVMTNSAKWAYYAPGILGVDVRFGSLRDCVEAMVDGQAAS